MRHLAIASLLLTVLVAACNTTPKDPRPEPSLDVTSVDDFDMARPARVVVRPVEARDGLDVPLAEVRLSAYKALIERLYAPLKLDLQPQDIPNDPALGTLVVRLDEWDRSRATREGVILVGGEAFLVKGEVTLWSARFSHLALRCRSDEPNTRRERDEMAARVLGTRLLRSLPIKADLDG